MTSAKKVTLEAYEITCECGKKIIGRSEKDAQSHLTRHRRMSTKHNSIGGEQNR